MNNLPMFSLQQVRPEIERPPFRHDQRVPVRPTTEQTTACIHYELACIAKHLFLPHLANKIDQRNVTWRFSLLPFFPLIRQLIESASTDIETNEF